MAHPQSTHASDHEVPQEHEKYPATIPGREGIASLRIVRPARRLRASGIGAAIPRSRQRAVPAIPLAMPDSERLGQLVDANSERASCCARLRDGQRLKPPARLRRQRENLVGGASRRLGIVPQFSPSTGAQPSPGGLDLLFNIER